MTSLPISFVVGSASSGQSVRDVIASYRRSQYLVADYTVASASDTSDFDDNDEEAGIFSRDDSDDDFEDDQPTPRPRDESFVGQLDWDEDLEPTERPQPRGTVLHFPRRTPALSSAPSGLSQERRADEHTPLLPKINIFPTTPNPHQGSTSRPVQHDQYQTPGQTGNLTVPATIQRRSSATSMKSIKYNYGGKSTFGQTLFNSIAILLGIGMLSEPLAFAYAGWGAGTVLIISYGFISCYTAKILARIILADPRLRSYADIGRKAFGPRSTLAISIMFCLELFAVSVVLVTLYADSLHSIIPTYSADTYKIWGLLLLIPTVFLPLSLLSYTSILGILSTLMIIGVIIIDGFSKRDSPGSFWSPAETSVGIENYSHLGLAFGLFMAGFAGHSVIPSLARDMIDPTEFNKMINWAFVIATFIYALIGYAGYTMFGKYVSDEISMDLLSTPGYNPILNQAALWMLVISPMSKFALTTQPLNATIEILLGIDTPVATPENLAAKSNGLKDVISGDRVAFKRTLAILQRVCVTLLSVGVSIMVPEFSSMMAFLGSFSAFVICVLGPISAKVMLAGRCGLFDGLVLLIGVIMAVWGTWAAFVSA
ncbi:transmembrane amino acid transporter protein-domain-containing protein [Infundibulicybe gibba]|nr:transmembrane amino acid transporter protein-domain-containing protein [Infundibulicybe gibba]